MLVNVVQRLLKERYKDRRTLVMGILNVTPDSFSDGGEWFETDKALARVREMVIEGVDIIDVGGESTRPESMRVGEEEELERIMPIVKALVSEFGESIGISVDTYKSVVADKVLKAGAHSINSMGGSERDLALAKVIAAARCPWVVYHVQGTPETMQKNPTYDNVLSDINRFFTTQVEILERAGGSHAQMILDPGIGFGKTTLHNITILRELQKLEVHDVPVLVGASRKRFLGELLARDVEVEVSTNERLEGSLAAVAAAVSSGASIVRVHDVKETVRFLQVFNMLTQKK